MTPGWLQQCAKLVSGQLTVMKNLAQQPGAYRFTCMNGNNRCASVGMLQEMVAAPRAGHHEASFAESGDDLPATDPRQTAHDSTKIRCTPTNSDAAKEFPSTSRHKPIASRILLIN